MKNNTKLAPLVAGMVAVTALVVMGTVVAVALATGRDVPWPEITLAVTTLLAAGGGWGARQPGPLRDRDPPVITSADLARAAREQAARAKARRGDASGGAHTQVLVALAIVALALVVAVVVTAPGCSGASRPDTPATVGRYARLPCSAVDAVCGAGVLPDAVQAWCSVASLACGMGAAVAVAVVDAVAAAPSNSGEPKCMYRVGSPRGAWCAPREVAAADWEAVCAVGHSATAAACAAWLAGDVEGLIFEGGRP